MIQLDNRAPELPIRASRKERFAQILEIFDNDEFTPNTSLANDTFQADLVTASGTRQASASVQRLTANTILVVLTTTQMAALGSGRYRLDVYSLTNGERADLVTIILTLEA